MYNITFMLRFTYFNVWFRAMVSVYLVRVKSADYVAIHNHHMSDHYAVNSCCVLIGRATSIHPGQKPDKSSCFVITTSSKFRGSQKVRKVHVVDVVCWVKKRHKTLLAWPWSLIVAQYTQ